MTLFCSQSSGVCCAVLCMSFQKGLKCSSERGEGFSSILSKPEEDWEGKRQAELGFFLLDVMNKVWYAWNGTFARSSILNYWTYWRNSKKKRILASRKQNSRVDFGFFSKNPPPYILLSKVKAMAIASNLSNILKVLFMVMRWSTLLKNYTKTISGMAQVICNLLYIHRYI